MILFMSSLLTAGSSTEIYTAANTGRAARPHVSYYGPAIGLGLLSPFQTLFYRSYSMLCRSKTVSSCPERLVDQQCPRCEVHEYLERRMKCEQGKAPTMLRPA
ncbi:hypothetical protein F4802DRAFT_254523 [Xylaria palmicola]|nr:hypothetical protein F4802DRAFT_254523 [Xylaria palmicola]